VVLLVVLEEVSTAYRYYKLREKITRNLYFISVLDFFYFCGILSSTGEESRGWGTNSSPNHFNGKEPVELKGSINKAPAVQFPTVPLELYATSSTWSTMKLETQKTVLLIINHLTLPHC
jgi:hypothetical protein